LLGLGVSSFNSIEWIRSWSSPTTEVVEVSAFNSIEWIQFIVVVEPGRLEAVPFNSIEWILNQKGRLLESAT